MIKTGTNPTTPIISNPHAMGIPRDGVTNSICLTKKYKKTKKTNPVINPIFLIPFLIFQFTQISFITPCSGWLEQGMFFTSYNLSSD
jgi:hypothetical protein